MEILRELPIVDAYHFDNHVEEGEETQIQVGFVRRWGVYIWTLWKT